MKCLAFGLFALAACSSPADQGLNLRLSSQRLGQFGNFGSVRGHNGIPNISDAVAACSFTWIAHIPAGDSTQAELWGTEAVGDVQVGLRGIDFSDSATITDTLWFWGDTPLGAPFWLEYNIWYPENRGNPTMYDTGTIKMRADSGRCRAF